MSYIIRTHLHIIYATHQTIIYSCDTIFIYNNRGTLGALKKKKVSRHTYSSSETTANVSIFRRRNFIKVYRCDNCTRRELKSRNVSAGKMATETNTDALYIVPARILSLVFHRAAITRVFAYALVRAITNWV